MSLADGDDAVMDEGAVGPTGDAAGAASSSRAAAANSYADLPALTSTPVVADLALTQGLTQDKEAGGGVSNLVDVLRQVWINERGERRDGWMRGGMEASASAAAAHSSSDCCRRLCCFCSCAGAAQLRAECRGRCEGGSGPTSEENWAIKAAACDSDRLASE